MADSREQHEVLLSILKVLERIEARLDGHEDRVKALEDVRSLTFERVKTGHSDASTFVETPGVALHDEIASHQEEAPPDTKAAEKVPYSHLSVDQFIRSLPQLPDIENEYSISHTQLDAYFDLELSKTLQQKVGDCWMVPDDNRFRLAFFKTNILKTALTWGAPAGGVHKAKIWFEKELEFLCRFDTQLRKEQGNDFVVIDFDTVNNSRIYRLGEDAAGPELMVEKKDDEEAPWSRLILYQGATTGKSLDTDRKQHPIPYFTRTDKIIGVWDHVSYHFQLKRRGTTVNPYHSRWTGFHTTFYEIREGTAPAVKELWKHGPLYNHPLGWHFRKCAFTIYSPVSTDTLNTTDSNPQKSSRHWTMLVLAPNKFFDERNTSFPMQAVENAHTQALGHNLGKLTQAGAELNIIAHGLEKISERWAGFQSYFDYILDSGDSLMQPAEHDNLLFDDGAFSRSRKYFWAIDCLSEFELDISDNLIQWELYKTARILPVQSILPELDSRQLAFAERQYRVLENQRESFRQKLASTKALRDALFNASAVIESRASTRLGENVKLLTFVSIFFLPLSFTTSLWSINDTFQLTVLIYVILIVAILTYLVMFNINTLAEGFGRLYNIKKKKIVRSMRTDRDDAWKHRAQRFEVFRPKHENPEPSEWYIPLYIFRNPRVLFGFGSPDTVSKANAGTKDQHSKQYAGVTGIGSLFRRRQQTQKEGEPPEEGWVM